MSSDRLDASGNPPRPFLNKCYDMVDDRTTDSTVSWTAEGETFVVWDTPKFSRDLLPKYFKHSNFSSFVRQLNTYGFRKMHPDRWEFANESFRKGQKHLLKSIGRRKHARGHTQQKQSQGKNVSVGACVEVGKFGHEEEIERLKRDKGILMQELVKLRQHQQSTDLQVKDLRERVQGMEQHQQQMLSFFVMAMQRPGFLAQLFQQNDWLFAEASKKRRLPALEQGTEDEQHALSSGQIVMYELPTNENSKPSIMPIANHDLSLGPNPPNGEDNLVENVDLTSTGFGMPLPLPMDAEMPPSEADDAFMFLEISSEELEQLLSATSFSENDEGNRPDIPEFMEDSTQFDPFESMEQKTESETSQNMDILTEQMGLLVSALNKEHEPV